MPPSYPPTPSERLLRPVYSFLKVEASGGILLLICAVLALVWANSPWGASYFDLWQTPVTVGVGSFAIAKPLLLWINDGLMAIFFFVVGLEIKREALVGELSSPKKAALPIAGAIGGMVLPALFYVAVTAGTPGISGWGIPMATDIAFAVGVLALLGRRAPLALKVFLLALAIIDDLGAVLVIAFFYTAELSWGALALGGVFLAGLAVANRMGVRRPMLYVLLGIGLWVAFLKSGVHATIAGVLLALTIPARRRIDAEGFLTRARYWLDHFADDLRPGRAHPTEDQQHALHELETAAERVETPLQRMEHTLHPWVAFFIMPVFALANAGVVLAGGVGEALGHPVTLGVILGLVLGKQLGVTAFAWAAVKMGLAELPRGVRWAQVYGVALLTGIGFTMSLFIAGLAFEDALLLDRAKLGILVASLISGVAGWALLARMGRDAPEEPLHPEAPHEASPVAQEVGA